MVQKFKFGLPIEISGDGKILNTTNTFKDFGEIFIAPFSEEPGTNTALDDFYHNYTNPYYGYKNLTEYMTDKIYTSIHIDFNAIDYERVLVCDNDKHDMLGFNNSGNITDNYTKENLEARSTGMNGIYYGYSDINFTIATDDNVKQFCFTHPVDHIVIAVDPLIRIKEETYRIVAWYSKSDDMVYVLDYPDHVTTPEEQESYVFNIEDYPGAYEVEHEYDIEYHQPITNIYDKYEHIFMYNIKGATFLELRASIINPDNEGFANCYYLWLKTDGIINIAKKDIGGSSSFGTGNDFHATYSGPVLDNIKG